METQLNIATPTPTQATILDLLNHIDNVCAKMNIEYILWGETAREGLINGELSPYKTAAEIAVKAEDFITLHDALNQLDPDHYYCDSFLTNETYPQISMRLHDVTTTTINVHEISGYAAFGIYVEIFPLRPARIRPSFYEKYIHMLEIGWYMEQMPYRAMTFPGAGKKLIARRLLAQKYARITRLAQKPQFLKNLFDKLQKLQSSKDLTVCWTPINHYKAIPASVIRQSRLISLHGYIFKISADESLMRSLYGIYWKDIEIKDYSSSTYRWSSTQMPYTVAIHSLENANIPFGEMYKRRQDLAFAKQNGKREYKRLKRYRNIVRNVGDQYFIDSFYLSQREDIVSHFSNKDYAWLQTCFEDYRLLMVLNKRNRGGMSVSLSPDLQEIFIQTLLHEGEIDIARVATKCLYKVHDVDLSEKYFPAKPETA